MTKKTHSTTTKPAKQCGFFQVSLDAARRIAANCSPNAFFAYIVLCWGVDHSAKAVARACTHGANSIATHTTISWQIAKQAMDELFEFGAILPPPGKARKQAITCLVGGDAHDFVDIDSRFVHNSTRSGLLALQKRVFGSHGSLSYSIPASQVQKDALLMFIALHDAQDFGAFGGVDPRVLSGEFTPLTPRTSVDECDHITSIAGSPAYALVSVGEPRHQDLSPAFAQDLLGAVPASTSCATALERATHAVQTLRDLKLIYTAHVLWDLDPLARPQEASPLGSLYVKGSSLSEMEHYLQYVVDAALRITDTVPGNAQFRRQGDDEYQSVYSRSGQYRYIVPMRDARIAKLVAQTRVRWWAFDRRNVKGIELDQARVAHQAQMLVEVFANRQESFLK